MRRLLRPLALVGVGMVIGMLLRCGNNSTPVHQPQEKEVLAVRPAPSPPVSESSDAIARPRPRVRSSPPPVVVQVTGRNVNVRTAPGLGEPVQTQLQDGATVEFLDERHGWCQVILEDGKPGWVFGAYLLGRLGRTTYPARCRRAFRTGGWSFDEGEKVLVVEGRAGRAMLLFPDGLKLAVPSNAIELVH